MKSTALILSFLLSLAAHAQVTLTSSTISATGGQSTFTQTFAMANDTGQEIMVDASVRGQDGYALMTDSFYSTSSRTIATAFPATAQQKVLVTHCINVAGDYTCFESFLYGDNDGEPEFISLNHSGDYDTTSISIEWYKGLSGNFQIHGFVANSFAFEDSGWAATRQFDVSNAPLKVTDSILTISLPNAYLERPALLKIIAWATNEYGSSDTASYLFSAQNSVGIAKNDIADIRCYPNPNSGLFLLTLPDSEPSSIVIYNSMGESVYSCSNVMSETKIDITGLGAGIYTYRIRSIGRTYAGRIMVK